MKITLTVIMAILITSCGYHLRSANTLAQTYPSIKINLSSQSLLRRPLVNALIASNIKLTTESDEGATQLHINKDALTKVIQSVGINNQVQEYRLEYDVDYSLGENEKQSIHLEKDYSFDIQQIGGGQSEEATLRKQLAEDMADAIIRKMIVSIKTKNNQ